MPPSREDYVGGARIGRVGTLLSLMQHFRQSIDTYVQSRITALAACCRLPAIYGYHELPDAGDLMTGVCLPLFGPRIKN